MLACAFMSVYGQSLPVVSAKAKISSNSSPKHSKHTTQTPSHRQFCLYNCEGLHRKGPTPRLWLLSAISGGGPEFPFCSRSPPASFSRPFGSTAEKSFLQKSRMRLFQSTVYLILLQLEGIPIFQSICTDLGSYRHSLKVLENNNLPR